MRPNAPNAPLLGAFWFGIQMAWGALLGISLQARAEQLAPGHAIGAYGLLAVSGACVAAITQIAAGVISDRRSLRDSRRVEFYAAGAIVGSAAIVWFYLAPVFWQLVAALLVLQFGLNVAIGPYQAAIPDFIGSRKLASATAWMAALQSLGNVAGALVAALVKGALVTGGVIATTVMLTCAMTGLHVRKLHPIGDRATPLRITRTFADLFISRALVYIGFYTLLGYLYFYVAQFLGGHAQQSTVKAQTGLLLVLFTAAAAAGALIAGRAERFDRRIVAAIGGSMFIIALIAFLLAGSFAQLVGCALLAGVAWGIFLTADWALGCTFLPRGALATAMGIWNLALLIPQMLAPGVVNSVLNVLHAMQNADAPRMAFVIACLEVGAGVAWLRRLPASVHDWGSSGNNAR